MFCLSNREKIVKQIQEFRRFSTSTELIATFALFITSRFISLHWYNKNLERRKVNKKLNQSINPILRLLLFWTYPIQMKQMYIVVILILTFYISSIYINQIFYQFRIISIPHTLSIAKIRLVKILCTKTVRKHTESFSFIANQVFLINQFRHTTL